ncbi:MAG: hypothetical protein B7C24_16990 [Bacteroidetes bacterium 4572_77]|nr:MAG: hypothetical protein B7C24_16990 [Bacteroidetes bacterium 4572_77]
MSYNNDKILEKYFFAAKDEKSIFKAKEMRTLIEKSTSPSAKSNYLKKNGGRIIIISLIIGLITIVSLQLTNDIHTQEETTQLTITNKQINESDNFEPKAVGTNLVTLRDTHIISNSNEDKKNKSNATEKQPQEPKETEPQISLSNDIIEKTDLPEDPPILIINDDINEPEIEITNENTSPTVANTEKASIAEKYRQKFWRNWGYMLLTTKVFLYMMANLEKVIHFIQMESLGTLDI